jgi:hypothetical protein
MKNLVISKVKRLMSRHKKQCRKRMDTNIRGVFMEGDRRQKKTVTG